MRQRTAQTVRNPVLAASHPDPSILRVGADFYLATSTFEWCPGRRPGQHPLARPDRGYPDSGGVWAPNLSHADGSFHLVHRSPSPARAP
ncbi:family 43 glycosylhydrolase [Streptomyces sp. NPDC090798]|uniref:family 43 glycosylhydrolase n=1 Tax=Streptomyces sp. NPDC090798 TaxID=3365968 RepID=UPI00382352D0